MRNTNTPIAVEGYPFILGFFAVSLLLALLGHYLHWAFALPAALFLFLALFTAFFFRNPERRTPENENAVIAPAMAATAVAESPKPRAKRFICPPAPW